jgi:chromosome segregation ATPase
MMHEEFMNLTGLQVSYNYYTKNIEPEYTSSEYSSDKQTFCEQWLKRNKANICKAVLTDIHILSRELAVNDTIRGQADRLREEKENAENRANEAERKLNESLNKLNALEKANEELLADVRRGDEKAAELQEKWDSTYQQFRSHENRAIKAEEENIVLKAKLYDLMIKTA